MVSASPPPFPLPSSITLPNGKDLIIYVDLIQWALYVFDHLISGSFFLREVDLAYMWYSRKD